MNETIEEALIKHMNELARLRALNAELVAALEQAGKMLHAAQKHNAWVKFSECSKPDCIGVQSAIAKAEAQQ